MHTSVPFSVKLYLYGAALSESRESRNTRIRTYQILWTEPAFLSILSIRRAQGRP